MLGNSFGGHLIAQALPRIDPMGIFLCGAPPLKIPLPADVYLPNPLLGCLYSAEVARVDVENLIMDMATNQVLDSSAISDFLKTDPGFRSSLLNMVQNLSFEDELKLLSNYSGQVALAAGKSDRFINPDYILRISQELELWSSELLVFEGGHSFIRDVEDNFMLTFGDFISQIFTRPNLFVNAPSSFTGEITL